MKRIASITSIIVGAALVCSCGGLKKMPEHTPIEVSAEENLIPKNGILPISLEVNIPREYKQLINGIQIRPVIKDKKSDRVLALEPMVIEGAYNKVFNERMDIYKPTHGDSITYRIPYQKESTVYTYKTEVPYENWFANAGIAVDIFGEAYHRRVQLASSNVEKQFTDYALGIDSTVVEKYYFWDRPVAPEFIPGGENAGSAAMVTFPLASADLKDNEGKVDFESYIDKVRNHSEVKDYNIGVTIANSPEGSLRSNIRLGETRKAAIAAYLNSLDADESKVNYTVIDENWEGLAERLPSLGLKHEAEILAAIDSIADMDVREHYIRDKYYEDWMTMRREIYPQLRLADIRINASYKGKEHYYMAEDSFTFDEDPSGKIYDLHSQMLEAVKEKDYELAAEFADQLPNTDVPVKLLSNKATVYLMNGRLDDARVLLERSAELENCKANLGMVYLKQQKYQKADETLESLISINAVIAKMYVGDYKKAADILQQLPDSEEKTLLLGFFGENLK